MHDFHMNKKKTLLTRIFKNDYSKIIIAKMYDQVDDMNPNEYFSIILEREIRKIFASRFVKYVYPF